MKLPFTSYAFLVIGMLPAFAQEVVQHADKSIEWHPKTTGAVVKDYPDGAWQVYAKDSETVRVQNRDGVDAAMVIAEERAKGKLVAFMQEDVAGGKLVAQVNHDIQNTLTSTTNASQNGSTQDRLSGEARQGIIDAVTQINSSYASGTLIGVVVLEQLYDKEAKEVTVTVGYSSRTTSAAQRIRTHLKGAFSDDKPQPSSGDVPSDRW